MSGKNPDRRTAGHAPLLCPATQGVVREAAAARPRLSLRQALLARSPVRGIAAAAQGLARCDCVARGRELAHLVEVVKLSVPALRRPGEAAVGAHLDHERRVLAPLADFILVAGHAGRNGALADVLRWHGRLGGGRHGARSLAQQRAAGGACPRSGWWPRAGEGAATSPALSAAEVRQQARTLWPNSASSSASRLPTCSAVLRAEQLRMAMRHASTGRQSRRDDGRQLSGASPGPVCSRYLASAPSRID